MPQVGQGRGQGWGQGMAQPWSQAVGEERNCRYLLTSAMEINLLHQEPAPFPWIAALLRLGFLVTHQEITPEKVEGKGIQTAMSGSK